MTLIRRHFCGLSCAALGAGLAGCAFNPAHLRAQVRPGDTAWKLGSRMPFTNFQTERFLMLNGMEKGDPLTAGSKIKLVLES